MVIFPRDLGCRHRSLTTDAHLKIVTMHAWTSIGQYAPSGAVVCPLELNADDVTDRRLRGGVARFRRSTLDVLIFFGSRWPRMIGIVSAHLRTGGPC